MMSPLPSLVQTYAVIVSNEGQKSIASTTGVLSANPSATMGNLNMVVYSRSSIGSNNTQRFKKGFINCNLICDFCKCKGHYKEQCYKLIGYPTDFKSKKSYKAMELHIM